MGLIVFLCVALILAWFWHALVPKYWIASTASGVTASILFQLAAALKLGYFEPFFLIGLVIGIVPAFLVALLLGLLFQAKRKRSAALK